MSAVLHTSSFVYLLKNEAVLWRGRIWPQNFVVCWAAAGSIIRRKNRRYYDLDAAPIDRTCAVFAWISHSILGSHTQHEAILYIPLPANIRYTYCVNAR